MKKIKFLLVFLSCTLCLYGCVSLNYTALEDLQCTKRATIGVSHASQWQAKGKILIENKKSEEKFYFSWLQDQNRYRIKISSYFSLGVIEIEGIDTESIKFNDSTKYDTNQQKFLTIIEDLDLTIADLRSWMQAKPARNSKYHLTFNECTIERIYQKNYSIEYLSYTKKGANIYLPHKILFTHNRLPYKILIIVTEWQVR